MKQINYSQANPRMGNLSGVLRIGGKFLYFRSNNNQYEVQIIAQMREKGAEIVKSATGWIRVDMFKANSLVKLGDKEFDANDTPPQEIEDILYNFYLANFTKAGFKCIGKNI